MFIASVEGPGHMNRGTWTTHRIVGVYQTREEAVAAIGTEGFDDEDIAIVTDVSTSPHRVERIQTGSGEA